VVDESENFAISNRSEPEAQQALAHDENSNPSFTNNNQIAKLLNQIQELQQTVQELRGQIDNQNHIIETIKTQQLSLYKDLDQRLTGLKPTSPKLEPEKTEVNTPLPIKQNANRQNPAEEQIAYMAAYNFVEQHELNKAILAFQEFIQKYPQSAYISNAEYWLGEVLLKEKNYAAAMAHFENVVNNFPTSNKHAAALYKLGVSLAENGQIDDAKNKYQALIQQYPDSDTSKLAENQLRRL
jgi:tol-pal system protein YbgF